MVAKRPTQRGSDLPQTIGREEGYHMGFILHHAIVVTTYSEGGARKAYDFAAQLFTLPCPPTVSKTNGYWTFFIPPDGSKEGWGASDDGDTARDAFVAWLEEQRFEDKSSPYAWAEVAYGEAPSRVIRSHRMPDDGDP